MLEAYAKCLRKPLFMGPIWSERLPERRVVSGGAVELPFLLATVYTFGGLERSGLFGLLIGPVIMVGMLLIWQQRKQHRPESPTS